MCVCCTIAVPPLLVANLPFPSPLVGPVSVHNFEKAHKASSRRYPQQVILAFEGEVEMDKIKTVTTNIRKLKVCSQCSANL